MLNLAKRLSLVPLVLAGSTLSFAQQVSRAESGTPAVLVSTGVIQDEALKLPEDMTAVFSNQDRRVRFQVVKLSSDDRQLFANKVISVVDPNGSTRRIQTDSSGYATLENASSGLHAVVVSEDSGHSAIPLAFREVSEDEAKSKAKAVRVPLAEIDPAEVLAAVRQSVASGSKVATSPIDNGRVTGASTDQEFGYSIALTSDGTLQGKVVSLLSGPNAISIDGTKISLFQNQALVATAIADSSGYFEIRRVRPGYYGLVCTGAAGYVAFGFEARDAAEVAEQAPSTGYTFVSTNMVAVQAAPSLPVVLVPQPMVDDVLQSVEEFYAPPLSNGVTPVTPFGAPGGFGGGLGGGAGAAGGGAVGGIGGAGGLVGLAAVGGVAAVAIGANNDNSNVTPPPRTNSGP